ncbi:MAG: carbohydrate binding family 9 domain-containing protein, partial [Flavobacteriaceae bacterium]
MRRILYLYLLGCLTPSFGQSSTIPFVSERMVIDGTLDESVWSALPEITGFHNYMPPDEGLSKHQTRVKLFHDGSYLYVGAIYGDTEARIQTSSLKRDVSIGISDAFILILDTQNQQQNGYYFAVNGYGTQVDGLVERIGEGFDFSLSWNTVWKSAASVEGTHKIYEMAIPLKALNYEGSHPIFGIQMYTRDIKKNAWTILTHVKRNYRLFDLRFTKPFA